MSDPFWAYCPGHVPGTTEYDLSDYGLVGKARVSVNGRFIRIDGIPEMKGLDTEVAYRICIRYMGDDVSGLPGTFLRIMRPGRGYDLEEFLGRHSEMMESMTSTASRMYRMAERRDDLENITRMISETLGYVKELLGEIKDEIPEERYAEYFRDISIRESYIRSLTLML